MMPNLHDMVVAMKDGKISTAQDAFDSVMSQKVSDALDLKRIEVAQNMFNSNEEVDSNVESDEAAVEDNVETETQVENQEDVE